MADDVNVKQSEVLKVYSTKLVDFRSVTAAGSALVFRQAGKHIEHYERLKREMELELRNAREFADHVRYRYENAFSQGATEDDRYYIGDSDEEANHKLEQLNEAYEELCRTIRNMETKLENIREKTKTYGSQMYEMCTRSSDMLKQRAEIIDNYKESR